MSGARADVGYKPVTCADCGRTYTCTPMNDYYEFTTAEDGVCFRCLLARNPARVTPVVAPVERRPQTRETG